MAGAHACTVVSEMDTELVCNLSGGYVAGSGSLVFKEGVTRQTIQIEVVDTSAYERHEEFEVVLSNAARACG